MSFCIITLCSLHGLKKPEILQIPERYSYGNKSVGQIEVLVPIKNLFDASIENLFVFDVLSKGPNCHVHSLMPSGRP